MSLMETRSGLHVGVGVGVGVGGNGSGNGNGKLNTHKRNVNGDSNQLTTHKGDQVVHKDLDMQEHYNFNEAINFNFQFTLPESLFQSEKKEQPQSTRRPHKVRSGEGRCMQPYPSTKRGHFQNLSIPKKEVENRRVEEDEEEDDDDDDDEEYTRRPHIVRSGKGRCMQPYPSTQRGYFQNFENDEQKSSDDEEESDDDDDDEEEEEYTRRPHIVRPGEGRPTQPYPTMQRGYSRNFGKDEEESSDDEEEESSDDEEESDDDDDKYTKLPHIVRSGEGRRTQPYPTTQRGCSRNFGKDKEESSDDEEESSDDEEEEEDDEEEYSMLAYGFTERRQLVMVCL